MCATNRGLLVSFLIMTMIAIASHAFAQERGVRTQANDQGVARKARVASSKKRPARRGSSPAAVLEERFDREAPQVGDPLPDVAGLDADGNEFRLRSLMGHYTVLTFGCLT